MPINPDELYAAAQRLNGLNPTLVSDEVCARTMLNRMYYAAYLATREAIRSQLRNPAFDVGHQTLSDTLYAATDPEVREIGSCLQVLRTAREESDYKLHVNIPKAFAALHLMNARFVLARVGKLSGRFPPLRPRRTR